MDRAKCSTTKRNTTNANKNFTDSDATNKDVCFRQFISEPLVAGQVIVTSELFYSVKGQVFGDQADLRNNMYLALGIAVWDSTGTILRKQILPVTRDDMELQDQTEFPGPGNRQFGPRFLVLEDYTTVEGDYLVIEIGTGGDPAIGSTHESNLRFGDDNASDLPENNTSTEYLWNPWVELMDVTLIFVSAFTPRVVLL